MSLYPVYLCLDNKPCVVVGAGEVAMRKIGLLLKANAKVTVIAPDASDIEGVEVIKREYKKDDLAGAFLVIAATDNKEVNKEIYEEANKKRILINIVDVPSLCNFYVPSMVDRGDLQISISTGGVYPALAKKIRKQLESQYGTEYEIYLELLREARKSVVDKYPPEERKAKLNQLLNDIVVMDLIKDKKIDEAKKRIQDCI